MTPEEYRLRRFYAQRLTQERAAAARAVTPEARERRLRLIASFEREAHALANIPDERLQ